MPSLSVLGLLAALSPQGSICESLIQLQSGEDRRGLGTAVTGPVSQQLPQAAFLFGMNPYDVVADMYGLWGKFPREHASSLEGGKETALRRRMLCGPAMQLYLAC